MCGESGEEYYSTAYEARLDANVASGQVPGPIASSDGSVKHRTCLRSSWSTETQTGQARITRSTTGAFEQLGQHPIEFSTTQHIVAFSSGEDRTCGSRRFAVSDQGEYGTWT